MGIFLIIVIIVVFCWPWISRWIRQYMARRAEDFLRRATGMPPRPGSREDKRRQRAYGQNQYKAREDSSSASSSSYSRRARQHRRARRGYDEPIIPPEYAEDVEFVETKSFSETTIGASDGPGRQYTESQVSDAEWVEIKDNRR